MRKQSQEEVAAAARRRLELLGRELEQAGLARYDDAPDADDVLDDDVLDDELGDLLDDRAGPTASSSRGAPVLPAGRHLRRSGRSDRPDGAPGWGRRLVERLPATFRGRTGLTAGPAVLVVVLVVLGLGATAWAVGRSRGEAVPVREPATAGRPLVAASPSATSSPPAAGSSSASPSPGTTTGGTVTVDVAGRVRHPGVATLPSGSRVVDALRHAGGTRPGVDLSALNLARVLVDGEQVVVGRAAAPTGAAAGSGPGGLAAGAAASAPAPSGALVSLNSASAEQLDTLPGVGPVTAQKILDWRTAHGAFSSVDELLEVDGIGDKTLADIAPHVTL